MKRTLLIFGFALIVNVGSTFAQASYLRDVSGRVFSVDTYTEVKGTPYLVNSWCKGSVKFSNGNILKNEDLMYDMVSGQVLYKKAGSEDVIMAFSDPIKSFSINVDGKGRNFIKNKTDNAFFEVLYDGPTKLVKQSQKFINEQSQYGSATKAKVIEEKSIYFLLPTNGDKIQLSKDKKATLAAMGNKQSAIDAYIKKEGLNLKNENDLIKIAQYYNTLN